MPTTESLTKEWEAHLLLFDPSWQVECMEPPAPWRDHTPEPVLQKPIHTCNLWGEKTKLARGFLVAVANTEPSFLDRFSLFITYS